MDMEMMHVLKSMFGWTHLDKMQGTWITCVSILGKPSGFSLKYIVLPDFLSMYSIRIRVALRNANYLGLVVSVPMFHPIV